MNRRGFLGSILTLAAAPAIVRADSLMRIVPRELLFDAADLVIPPVSGLVEGGLGVVEGVSIRSAARAGLVAWWAGEIDRIAFEHLSKSEDGCGQAPELRTKYAVLGTPYSVLSA